MATSIHEVAAPGRVEQAERFDLVSATRPFGRCRPMFQPNGDRTLNGLAQCDRELGLDSLSRSRPGRNTPRFSNRFDVRLRAQQVLPPHCSLQSITHALQRVPEVVAHVAP